MMWSKDYGKLKGLLDNKIMQEDGVTETNNSVFVNLFDDWDRQCYGFAYKWDGKYCINMNDSIFSMTGEQLFTFCKKRKLRFVEEE